MISTDTINNLNKYLLKTKVNNKKISAQAKNFYLFLLLQNQTFLPFRITIQSLIRIFELSKPQVCKILKELEDAKLLKKDHRTFDNGSRKIGNSLYLQLIPPHPYRFLKGELVQSRTSLNRQYKYHEIVLTKIRDIHDWDFTQDYHFITHSTEDEVLKKALDGMESGFDLFFVAEVKGSKKGGGTWLDHSTHFTNDWLIREHEKALEALELEDTEEEVEEPEDATPPSPFDRVGDDEFCNTTMMLSA